MRKRVAMMVALGLLTAVTTSPVAARGASVDRLEGFESVVIVGMPDDFPIASIMRADCSRLIRIERPNGSSTEIQDCQLSDRPVMIPEFQGQPPSRAFVFDGPACEWHSDYWFYKAELDVLAESVHLVVTPSGHVHAVSEYPAEPLACEA